MIARRMLKIASVAGIAAICAAVVAVCLLREIPDADRPASEKTRRVEMAPRAPEKKSGAGDRHSVPEKSSEKKVESSAGEKPGGKSMGERVDGETQVDPAIVSENEADDASSSISEEDEGDAESVREIFSQVSPDGDTDAQLVQALASFKAATVLSAARSVMENGTAREKENALCAVGLLFGKESSTGVAYEYSHPKNEIAVDSEGVESVASEARPSGTLVSTVLAGFSDSDESVRDMAFSVMRSLPDEESGAIASSLIAEGDPKLQARLMREAGEEADFRMSLMGMASDSPEVRVVAAENLKNLSGREFANQRDAAEWFEANYRDFPQKGDKQTQPQNGGIK